MIIICSKWAQLRILGHISPYLNFIRHGRSPLAPLNGQKTISGVLAFFQMSKNELKWNIKKTCP